jgi:hypothetical protein
MMKGGMNYPISSFFFYYLEGLTIGGCSMRADLVITKGGWNSLCSLQDLQPSRYDEFKSTLIYHLDKGFKDWKDLQLVLFHFWKRKAVVLCHSSYYYNVCNGYKNIILLLLIFHTQFTHKSYNLKSYCIHISHLFQNGRSLLIWIR